MPQVQTPVALLHAGSYPLDMIKERLNRNSWINAGFDALCEQGPNALAAEPLARRLSTTKGSFYWHFKDVPTFQAAILNDWQTRAFAKVITALEETDSTADRLRRFGRAILNDRQEASLRGWARADPKVAAVVQQVDAERLTYVTNLLGQIDIRNPDFARASFAALIGLPQLPDSSNTANNAAFDALIDLVLALR
ncbi:MAG: TetR/AcrR family transcriptional regulator [Sulfitobacter sp.]